VVTGKLEGKVPYSSRSKKVYLNLTSFKIARSRNPTDSPFSSQKSSITICEVLVRPISLAIVVTTSLATGQEFVASQLTG
jgi:hypothetical protein